MSDWADEIALKLLPLNNGPKPEIGLAFALRKAKADGYREAAAMQGNNFRVMTPEHFRAEADRIERGEA